MGDVEDDSSDEGITVSHEARITNKRKYLSSSSTEVLDEAPTENCMYETLAEKLYEDMDELRSTMENLGLVEVDQQVQEDEQFDWDDPIAFQLEELLKNNLFTTFCGAVKTIIECGYTEEAAERAVSICSLFYGSRDAVMNILDGALALLKWEDEFNALNHSAPEGLQNLANYKLIEMINVLRQIRPELTVSEAMWSLLISDLNIVNACLLNGGEESPRENPTASQSKPEASSTSQSNSNKLDNPIQQPSPGESASPTSQVLIVDKKPGGSRGSSKREMLRQKPFDKNHKGRLSKGAFKAKVVAWGNMVAEKALKLQAAASAASSGVVTKENLPKLDGPKDSVKDSASGVDSSDCCISIPFDENLQKYIPKDEKDEAIVMMNLHKESLKEDLERWMEWTNEKVRQATRRLGEDQAELKRLRQEKEELEKLMKEKQSLEETAMKRLTEMDYKLSATGGQIEFTTSTIRRLEIQNSILKERLAYAKTQGVKSATNLDETVAREQEALRKVQLFEANRGLVVEELNNLKSGKVQLVGWLERVKERHSQFKVLLRHEERMKSKAAAQLNSLRQKREELEASTKAEEDNIKQTAQNNMQKHKEDIKNLENMISELRMESDKAKIAALNAGYGSLSGVNASTFFKAQAANISKKMPGFQDNVGGVKQERECVMCMTDEISVVFLPCAHQVLCHNCSVLHEKQGMKDCPSCRTSIQRRISVSYRAV